MRLNQSGQRLCMGPAPGNVFPINLLGIAANLEMQSINQAGMCAAVSGVDSQSPAELGDRLVNQAQVPQRQAQIGMSRREIRAQLNRPAM